MTTKTRTKIKLIKLFTPIFIFLAIIGGGVYEKHLNDTKLAYCASLATGHRTLLSSFNQPVEAKEVEEVTEKIEGEVSWYDAIYDGFNCDDPACIQANGEAYNPKNLTAACHPMFELGDYLRVDYGEKTVVVRCTDRGAFWKEKYGSRLLDLSKGAFSLLAPITRGVIRVEVTRL